MCLEFKDYQGHEKAHSHLSHPVSERLYADRTSGGHCHHRHPCRHASSSIGQGKGKGPRHQLHNNLKQLMLAWRYYADDNNGWLVSSLNLHNSPEWITALLTTMGVTAPIGIEPCVETSPLWDYTGGSQLSSSAHPTSDGQSSR